MTLTLRWAGRVALCISVSFTKYNSGDQINTEMSRVCSTYVVLYLLSNIRVIKLRQMGKACDMYGSEERCIEGFGVDARGKETTWRFQA